MEEDKIRELIDSATAGDSTSLNELIHSIKDRVYNLAIRMLLFEEDAKDATQEILIKVVTNLGSFRGESKFSTWVYRVASNYLIQAKGKLSSQFAIPFEDYEVLIDTGHSDTISYTKNLGEQHLLEEEVKVSCTHGLLLCLNSQARMVYILSDILEFNSKEGAEILGIKSENFRKILSRARKAIRGFLSSRCGLMDASRPCRCKKKVDYLIDKQAIDPQNLQFAQHTNRSIDLVSKIDELDKSLAIYRSVPDFSAPDEVINSIRKAIEVI